jgi:drug/metabolite transporter (DMT)-like permease
MAFLGAVAWALYSILTRRWSQGADGAVSLFIPAAGLGLSVLSLLSGESPVWSVRPVGEAVVLAIMTVLAYALWDTAMRRGNLLLVVVCSYLTPLLSTCVSCVYLGVEPGWRLWLGCLVLVAGSFMTWLSVSDRLCGDKGASRPDGECQAGGRDKFFLARRKPKGPWIDD